MDVRRGVGRAVLARDRMPTPITREKYELLKQQLDDMRQVQIPEIAQRVAEARAEGDLRENAEYHAQRENLGLLQSRIVQLESKLADCMIIDPSTLPKDRIVFGKLVTLRDVEADEEEKYQLVGPGEE